MPSTTLRLLPCFFLLLSNLLLIAPSAWSQRKDSAAIYQKELQRLTDSALQWLQQTEPYKQASANYLRAEKASDSYSSFMLYGDVIQTDFGAFNNSIAASGLERFGALSGRVGFGSSFKRNRLVIDVLWFLSNIRQQREGPGQAINYEVHANLMTDVGYDLLPSPRFNLYPFAGLRFHRAQLTYERNGVANPAFTNITNIRSGGESIDETSFRFGYQVGMGAEAVVKSSKGDRNGIIFFVKGGIQRPFGEDRFEINGVDYRPGITPVVWAGAFGIKLFTRP